jgi:tetratricopeptide (TPR) repeat protein
MKTEYIIAAITAITLNVLIVNIIHAQTDIVVVISPNEMNDKRSAVYQVASQDTERTLVFNTQFNAISQQTNQLITPVNTTGDKRVDLEKAYNLDPNNMGTIQQLAAVYYDYHQFQKALDFANRCKASTSTQRIIAMSTYQLENYDDAVIELLNVIHKDPKDAEATYAIGRSLLELEDYHDAIPYYNKAIELDPAKSGWMYELGLVYYNNNDCKNAVVFFDKAAAAGYIQSNDYTENLGFACMYSGDFNRGEKILSTLLSQRPSDKEFLSDIADAYYDCHLYDQSLEFCQKLITLDATNGKALYRAGLCFQKKGEKDKGQQMCDRAIELDPSLANLRQKQMSMGL